MNSRTRTIAACDEDAHNELMARIWSDLRHPRIKAAADAEWEALSYRPAKAEAAAHYAANRERLDAMWANPPKPEKDAHHG